MLQFLCRRRKCDGGGVISHSHSHSDTRKYVIKLLKWMMDDRWDKVSQFLSEHPYNIRIHTHTHTHIHAVRRNSAASGTTSVSSSISGSGCLSEEEEEFIECAETEPNVRHIHADVHVHIHTHLHAQVRGNVVDLLNVGGTSYNILHICCMFHPPIRLIHAIVLAEPRVISMLNDEGQYPLHIAAEYGAALEVIGLLIDHFPNALWHQDVYGQSPLHKVCQSYAANHRDTYFYPFHEGFVRVGFGFGIVTTNNREQDVQDAIQMITRRCPAVSNLEDNQHCNALEYALASDGVNLDTIQCIQRASFRTWREAVQDAAEQQRQQRQQTQRRRSI